MVYSRFLNYGTRARGILRSLTIAIILTFGLGGGAIAIAAPAQAATCSGASCSGVDPQSSGCSASAITIGWWAGNEVRWSSACQAVWFRNANGVGAIKYTFKIYQIKPANQGCCDLVATYVRDYSNWEGTGTSPAWTSMVPMSSTLLVQISGVGYSSPSVMLNTLPW
jgi:hypothetical protein